MFIAKPRIAVVLSLFLLCIFGSPLKSQDAVTRTSVHVRARPELTATSRTIFPRGATLTIIRPDTVGGYVYVEGPGETHGWVIATSIRVQPGVVIAPRVLGLAPTLVGPFDPAGATGQGGVAGPFHGCPLLGDAKLPAVKQLNVLKNRANLPTAADIDPAVSLQAILQPGNDAGRWHANRAAVVTGFVVTAHKGGVETVNCHSQDPLFMDTHINVALSPSNAMEDTRQMIVEVTPRWRPNHPNWTTTTIAQAIQGHWVRFTGWLLFDAEHATQSENTAPGKPGDWRATAWELHPVTKIEILPGPPANP